MLIRPTGKTDAAPMRPDPTRVPGSVPPTSSGSKPDSGRLARSSTAPIELAIAQIPNGLFVMASQSEGRSAAVPVQWVQQCATNPPMVMVALEKGQSIEPIVRESRYFSICQISAEDRFLVRKFAQKPAQDEALLAMMMTATSHGSPILDRAMSYLDCEIVRHVELDCDYRIYVGQVHGGGMLNSGTPAICYGTNGSSMPSGDNGSGANHTK
jgi:3-hydroxy-9,10-secoandrosta-1,3,5(10)-triene-9,17-dione monooxygenase reductase component